MGQGTRGRTATSRKPATHPGRRAGAYTQTERVLELLARLGARRTAIRLDELAADLDVSVKQLRRDLGALGGAGYQTELVRIEGRSAVRLLRGKTEPVVLTFRERITLLAIRDVFTALEGTPLAEDARSIFDKVLATLPDDTARDVSRLGARFRYLPDGGLKSYADHADVVDALLTATVHRHAVDATYRSNKGRLRTGRFEPWGLALHKNGLYVVGRFDDAASPIVLAVERFEKAERRRTARFEIPDDFSLESFFDGAFGVFVGSPPERVVLDFDANVRPLVTTRRWHRSQETTVLPDGRVRMQLDVGVSPDLVAWVVGWGPMVVVSEPTHLAERVRSEHEQERS
jgi:predicted DNA-binding transcriptional regulator YafY